jgi:hypothetical protein
MSRAAISSSIFHVGDTHLPCAVRAAEVLTASFHTMADDGDLAVLTPRRERLDRALE